ncbi:MAG: NAD-binding protein, partial [bacterium]|nr:NAD-binding protein [bacterium]
MNHSTKNRSSRWFPHIPLGVALGILGLLNLVPVFETVLGLPPLNESLADKLTTFWEAAERGLPQGLMGAVLLLVAVGIGLRSRLAWMVSVFILFGMLILELLPQSGPTKPMLAVYTGLLLFSILISFPVFKRATVATGTLFATTLILMLLSYSVIGTYILGQDFVPPIPDLMTALYFSVVTLSTVGYGHYVPQTEEAQFFVITMIIFGLIVIGTALSAVLIPVMNRGIQSLIKPRGKKMERSNHYIIIGNTPLARNVFQELKNRDQKITLILDKQPTENSPFIKEDIVLGEGSDLDILKTAGGPKAKAILALGDNDSENAFMIIAAKELEPQPQTVTIVNESKNQSRLKRLRPDIILA